MSCSGPRRCCLTTSCSRSFRESDICVPKQDMEWYDPDAAITEDGKLVITLSQEPWNGMNFRSAMLQSWNKFCFTGGLIEVSASFPGSSRAMGFWCACIPLCADVQPAVIAHVSTQLLSVGPASGRSETSVARATAVHYLSARACRILAFQAARSLVTDIANLIFSRPRAASVDGTWPYSYDSCDVGTLPNQTWPNGTAPEAARTSGLRDYGGSLSYVRRCSRRCLSRPSR